MISDKEELQDEQDSDQLKAEAHEFIDKSSAFFLIMVDEDGMTSNMRYMSDPQKQATALLGSLRVNQLRMEDMILDMDAERRRDDLTEEDDDES